MIMHDVNLHLKILSVFQQLFHSLTHKISMKVLSCWL